MTRGRNRGMRTLTDSRGILWDMDGVLVDSGEFHFAAWSAVLAEYGIPFSREQFRSTFGMTTQGTLAVLCGERLDAALAVEIGERKERAFRDAVRGHARPLPGVTGWLARLQRAGYRQAIASSAPPENIAVLVEALQLDRYFEALVSGFDLAGKPDPALFLKTARLLGVPPERCVVVEDAVVGVVAARRAGMKCVAVTTTNPAEALAAADVVVERLDLLPADTFECLLPAGEVKPCAENG